MTVTGIGGAGRRHQIVVEVDDTDAAVRFYLAVFAGVESSRECLYDGQVLHADIKIRDYLLSVGTSWPPAPEPGPSELRFAGADLEQILERFADAGAQIERGDGIAVVDDMFGHRWRMLPAG